MKKLIQLFTLSVMAVMLAVPAFAQQPTASPAAATATTTTTTQDDTDAKAALYAEFLRIYKTDQPAAYEVAKQYVQKYPSDDPKVIEYLKTFITKYEEGTRGQNFTKLLTDKKWAEAFALGKQIAASKPEDLGTHLNTSWAGLQLALSTNSSNPEAATFATKTIQMIESGKTLEAGKPYADKDKQEALGWLNFSLGFNALKANRQNEAASYLIKAVQTEGTTKANPTVYAQLAAIYEGEYGRLQESYDAKFKDQPESEESKAALQQVKQFLEPMIDAYARAVAYSGDAPGFQQVKTASKQRLDELYKFARGSVDGVDALVASVKTKPIPPQPNAPTISAPATSTTTTGTSTTPTGTQTGATTPATTTQPGATTPATTTQPATATPTTTTPATKTPATTTGTKPEEKKPATTTPATPKGR